MEPVPALGAFKPHRPATEVSAPFEPQQQARLLVLAHVVTGLVADETQPPLIHRVGYPPTNPESLKALLSQKEQGRLIEAFNLLDNAVQRVR